MKHVITLLLLFVLSDCTPKCHGNYNFNLYFIVPGSNENYYYYISNSKRKYWDTNRIRQFIQTDSNLRQYSSFTKYVAFYNYRCSGISENEVDLDEAEIEKYLIVRYQY